MGTIFEDMARSYAWTLLANGTLGGDQVSSWHSRDGRHEVDLVGTRKIHDVTFVGSVKWRRQALDRRVLTNLEEHAHTLLNETTPRLLIGSGGVEPSIASLPHVMARSIEEIYER